MSSREDWQRRLGPLYGGAVALVTSTPWRWPTSVVDDARSPSWVVALGLPIGLCAWLIAILVHAAGLPSTIAALCGLAMLTVASAALAERGLAERVDDWQTGSESGARSASVVVTLVLVFVTALRCAAIIALPPAHWIGAFVATALGGRWAAVFLQALGDPVTPRGDDGRRSLVATPAPAWLTAAISGAVAVVVIFALGKAGVLALALVAVAAFSLGLEAQRRDGGLSAPVVGTAAAVGELLVLLVATIAG
jgi:adenosylcobinamide-GDP ribazoletransferase